MKHSENDQNDKVDFLLEDPHWTPSEINAHLDKFLTLTSEIKSTVLECLRGKLEMENLSEQAQKIIVFAREKIINLFFKMQILQEEEFQSAQQKMELQEFLLFLQTKLVLAKEDPANVLSIGTKFSLEFLFEKMKNLGAFVHEYYLDFLNEKMQRENYMILSIDSKKDNHGEIIQVSTKSFLKNALGNSFRIGGKLSELDIDLSKKTYKEAIEKAKKEPLQKIVVTDYIFNKPEKKDQVLHFEAQITYLGIDRHTQKDLFLIEFQDTTERHQLMEELKEMAEKNELLANSYRGIARKNLEEASALQRTASTDDLTKVINRKGFDECLQNEFDRAVKNGSDLSLVMLDLDFFKQVNDTRGHLVGDEVLKQIARYLKNYFRKTDLVTRYGGEEFAIILKETDLQGAKQIAEKICQGIKALTIHLKYQETISVTASLGVTQLDIQKDTPESFVEKADNALYMAKNNGRNQVCVTE